MKKSILFTTICTLTCFALTLMVACKKNKISDTSYGINANSNPDMVNKGLRQSGKLIKGTLPHSIGSGSGGVLIVSNPEAVEVAAGVDVYIPYTTNIDSSISKLFVQVEGADSYWEIPARINGTTSGPLAMKIFIPNFVQKGDFNLIFSVADKNGNVSPTAKTNTIVTSALNCNSTASGSIGITVKSIDLGVKKGLVYISYNTYTVKDRIDVWHNNSWIVSTGEVYEGYFPACTNYSQAEAAGFVSGTGVLSFDYDPATQSRNLSVYITGCSPTTAWDVQVDCPEDSMYATLPDCPCTYQEVLAKEGTEEDGGTWHACGTPLDYHYGATNEARWWPNLTSVNPGQQCTYAANGELITGGIAAGSPDQVSPRTCGGLTSSSPGHYFSDVAPWSSMPCWQYLNEWPANQGINCGPKKNITTINHCANMILVIDDMPCSKARDLIKGAHESTVIDPDLKNLLTGGQDNSTKAVLLQKMEAWHDAENCDPISTTSLCIAIKEAIENLKK